MDVSQRLGQIAEAISVAAQSQNICTFGMCMTKSEWASATQAFFSVLAIFIAVLVPIWQNCSAKREKKFDQRIKAEASALLFYGSFTMEILSLRSLEKVASRNADGDGSSKLFFLNQMKFEFHDWAIPSENVVYGMLPLGSSIFSQVADYFTAMGRFNNFVIDVHSLDLSKIKDDDLNFFVSRGNDFLKECLRKANLLSESLRSEIRSQINTNS